MKEVTTTDANVPQVRALLLFVLSALARSRSASLRTASGETKPDSRLRGSVVWVMCLLCLARTA